MTTKLTEKEAMEFLRSIERGDVTLKAKRSWDETFAGDVEYEASNGWNLVVFNDCDDWDYIDSIRAADGRELDFDDIFDAMPELCNYVPGRAVALSAYGYKHTYDIP